MPGFVVMSRVMNLIIERYEAQRDERVAEVARRIEEELAEAVNHFELRLSLFKLNPTLWKPNANLELVIAEIQSDHEKELDQIGRNYTVAVESIEAEYEERIRSLQSATITTGANLLAYEQVDWVKERF